MNKGLAVGINNYPFGILEGCVEDAQAFAEIIQWNGDPKNGIQNFEMTVRQNILRAPLKRAIREHFAKDADMLLFYFSGHGELNESGGYILSSDSEEDDPGVGMDFILNAANRARARERIIILDCCNSGSIGESTTYTPVGDLKRGVTILTASSENQAAFQINGRGAFTSFLIDALKGGASDILGNITPGSVYTYIDNMLGLADEQRPIFKTNVSRFTVLRTVTPPVSWKILSTMIDHFPKPDELVGLNPSFEYTNVKGAPGAKEPYAVKRSVSKFKELQKLQSIGLVIPHDAPYMYDAAMNWKSCKLTTLGKQYWEVINRRINIRN